MQGLQQMINLRGGVQTLSPLIQRIVTWSDFCHANVFCTQPLFPRLPLSIYSQHTFGTPNPNLLDPQQLFGIESPITPIISNLRALSSDLDPNNIKSVNRLSASNQIYHLEYSLLLLLNFPSNFHYPKSLTLATAAHLYLYLVIREISPTSELIYRLVRRLQEGLEPRAVDWWMQTEESKRWLLWIYFMGGIVTAGGERVEHFWFVKGVESTCRMMEIRDLGSLIGSLKKCVWQDGFCEQRCADLWKEVVLFEEGM